MTNEEAKQLLIKYNAGLCTASEKAVLEDWYLNFNEHEIDISSNRIEEIGQEIYTELPIHARAKTMKLWVKISSVAAILILSLAIWKFYPKPIIANGVRLSQDIAPGGKRAILTLGNGKRIDLSHHKTGLMVKDAKINYLDGTVINQEIEQSGFQTLTTPNGGEYHIVLPDGTKVWLNAGSSLIYPVTFKGKKERRVSLTGEAYFEVEKLRGEKMPFLINLNFAVTGAQSQEVEVLGTHFNINTYNQHLLKTTLIEGSVKVSTANGKSVKLKPGEQATFSNLQFNVKKVDTDIEVAWKNGKTAFENADIKDVMILLKNWYDIEVKYDGELTDAKFSGSVSRTKNISSVLKLLESTKDVHFKINGREITVMN